MDNPIIPAIKGKDLNLEVASAGDPHELWTLRKRKYKYFLKEVKRYCKVGKMTQREKGMLFNLEEDAEENENIIHEKSGKARKLREKLCEIYIDGLENRHVKKAKFSRELTSEEKRGLVHLGYLDQS